MAWRDIIGFVAAVFVFIVLVFVISTSAKNFGISPGNPIFRLVALFLCFFIASSVYYQIKGHEKEKSVSKRVKNRAKSAKGKDISRRLNKMKQEREM